MLPHPRATPPPTTPKKEGGERGETLSRTQRGGTLDRNFSTRDRERVREGCGKEGYPPLAHAVRGRARPLSPPRNYEVWVSLRREVWEIVWGTQVREL